MTSKEKLTSLVSALEITGEANIKKDVVKQYKEDIEKDLEVLEEYKKILGTPIQSIMKSLRKIEILDILKRAVIEDELFKLDDDGVGNRHKYILVDYDSYHASSITSEEYELIKEWLNERQEN